MTAALPIILKVSLLTFLVSSMLGMGLSLTPHSLLAPITMLVVGTFVILLLSLIAAAWLRRQAFPNSHSHDPA